MAARAILLLTTASLLALAAGAAAGKWTAPPERASPAAGDAASNSSTRASTTRATPIDFNRDVRPILSDRCFGCHGPDAARGRRAGLRLDTEEGSRTELASGARAIVPGDLDASEAVRRMLSDDPDEVMPPPELKRPLSAEERATLVRWIEEQVQMRAAEADTAATGKLQDAATKAGTAATRKQSATARGRVAVGRRIAPEALMTRAPRR